MIIDRVKELLAEQLNIDKNTVTEKSNIVDDLGADSLDVVELIMTLEDEYGIEIPDDEVARIKTVGQIVDYIEQHKK